MFALLTTYKSVIYTLIFLYIISLQNSYLFTIFTLPLYFILRLFLNSQNNSLHL